MGCVRKLNHHESGQQLTLILREYLQLMDSQRGEQVHVRPTTRTLDTLYRAAIRLLPVTAQGVAAVTTDSAVEKLSGVSRAAMGPLLSQLSPPPPTWEAVVSTSVTASHDVGVTNRQQPAGSPWT